MPVDSAVHLVDIIYTFFFFPFESVFLQPFLVFFLEEVTLLLVVEGVQPAVSFEYMSTVLFMLDCFPSCPSLLSFSIFLQATVPHLMRRAGYCIVILVSECAVSSLATEQKRAGNKITVNFHIKRPVIH